MGKTARSFPNIFIVPTKEISGGFYDYVDNSVFIIGLNDSSEDEIMKVMSHELEHWAQLMFLTKKDIIKIMKAGEGKQEQFIEKINTIK